MTHVDLKFALRLQELYGKRLLPGSAMCVCERVCACVCKCVRVSVCVHKRTNTHTQSHRSAVLDLGAACVSYMPDGVRMYACICVYIDVCVCMCVYVCKYMYIHVRMYIRIYIRVKP